MDLPPHGPYAPDMACKCKKCVEGAAVADTADQIRNLLDYLHRMGEEVTEKAARQPTAPARARRLISQAPDQARPAAPAMRASAAASYP